MQKTWVSQMLLLGADTEQPLRRAVWQSPVKQWNETRGFHTTQQLHSPAFIPEKWRLTFTLKPVREYSQQLYLQQPKTEQSRCPSAGAWLNQLWYVHTKERHLAMKVTNCGCTQHCGWMVRESPKVTYCRVHRCLIPEMTDSGEQTRGCQGSWRKWGREGGYKGQQEEPPLGWGCSGSGVRWCQHPSCDVLP